ncbi:Zinc finger MYM-type protein 1 [Holothuria leucospilota]|uniref:Zinc finger MYM-type protein 1 n=1 Tax=Holothuria leucospilota TaxID=206669 RepID=A0A9Q1HCP4_HOLLE|nr:Zinc finger MYM-type protein 1 [Holothuria leucospilota]
MALRVLRDIVNDIKGSDIYSIMADETADVSNTEQLVLCLRWVTDELTVHEDFIGMHPLNNTSADHIISIIKDVLLRLNLHIKNARGQCYDGASAMSGTKSGVATQFKALNKKCLYTHCYGHALNLAVCDSVKSVGCLKEVFETAFEICKLIKKSPKRDSKLDEIRKETKNEHGGIRTLCPTRWTVRGQSLNSLLQNFKELMQLWSWSLDHIQDTEMKARINGVKSVMPTFKFLFGASLGAMILRQTDNLSRTLQDPKLSAAEGQSVAKDVVKTLRKDRRDESFEFFWEQVLQRKETLGVEDPKLPRKRKCPARLEEGNAGTHHFPSTPKDHYRCIFFEAFDVVTTCIQSRFEQPDYQKYTMLQELLLNAAKGCPFQKQLEEVCQLYDELDRFTLEAQLPIVQPTAKALLMSAVDITVHDLVMMFQRMTYARRSLLSEVMKVAKLLLVMPATNAVSERSFSALKRVKTYLRSTTTDSRMNNLMVLHIHKERVDKLNLIEVANEFVEKNDRRRSLFGKFKP